MKTIYDSLLFSFLLLQIYHLFCTISNFDVLEPIIARLCACKARQKPLLNLFCLYNYTNYTFIIIKDNYDYTNHISKYIKNHNHTNHIFIIIKNYNYTN